MSSYNLEIEGVGTVKVTKKRGMRSVRLRISPKGEVLVSAPWTVPKPFIKNFINDKTDWIIANKKSQNPPYSDGMIIGDIFRLSITDRNPRNSSKIIDQRLHIKLQGNYDSSSKKQQKYIERKIIDSMLAQAENDLLPRLHHISEHTGIKFNQGYVKRLTSRWGSCDQNKNIILNVFLLQVPENIRDYVIVHELAHTKYLNHSKDFWNYIEQLMPSYKIARKELKEYSPNILISNLN